MSDELNLNWDKVPSYTTIRAIIQGVHTEQLEKCFRRYVEKTSNTEEGSVISCDGKTLRGSYNNMKDQSAIHVLNIYNTENKMMLGQEKVSEKTNEIPVLQNLVFQFDIQNCTLTGDALHCQKKL